MQPSRCYHHWLSNPGQARATCRVKVNLAASDVNATELQRYFQSAEFSTSAERLDQCPASEWAEIAFAGRSNAGKSSAINTLCSQKRLARTSKTPGRTQLINFFTLKDQRQLVDLPGYGYAKVAHSKRLSWQRHLENYLVNRPNLTALVVLMDIRHPLQASDEVMLDWANEHQLPCIALLTKADKLKRGAAKQARQTLVQQFKDSHPLQKMILFSAVRGDGLDELRQSLYEQLHPPA